MFLNQYDVIVVGAGHAGCEAAAAAANMGCSTLLVTMNLQNIAQMSCNPAMGGLAKGQIVREIDALGGYSGIVSDKTSIQFKMLNLKHELLKLEKAIQQQGEDTKRQSKTNDKNYNGTTTPLSKELKDYLNSVEILNRQSLPLQPNFNQKVQNYFKGND